MGCNFSASPLANSVSAFVPGELAVTNFLGVGSYNHFKVFYRDPLA